MLLSVFHRMREGAALLEWRIWVFFLGAVLGLAGIFLDISWLVTTALVVLVGGVVVRGLAVRSSGSEEQEPTTPDHEPATSEQEQTTPER
ncbi:MAG: hypothetical protein V3T24_03240 [Longimicrobiales bacterium]